MPINIVEVQREIDRENEELRKKIIDLGSIDVSDMSKSFGALIAIETAIHARLGDMIILNLRTGR